jgi:hypothetical protein
MFRGDGVPRHLRYLVRDLDSMGDGTGRRLVRSLAVAQVWEPYFQVVRWRERQGSYELDHDDTYVLAMINALGGGMQAEILNQAIREDVDLRETTLWRIFGVPGTRRVNLAYLERYRGEPGEGWESSIQTRSRRNAVARACCAGMPDALTCSFSPAETAWFRWLRSKITRL